MTENNNNKSFDLVGKIIDFENGELSDDETIELYKTEVLEHFIRVMEKCLEKSRTEKSN